MLLVMITESRSDTSVAQLHVHRVGFSAAESLVLCGPLSRTTAILERILWTN